MKIQRTQGPLLRQGIAEMPIVTLMGPRQSGKTTLARQELPDWTYVNLEQLDMRDRAIQDPRGFLEQYGKRVILDEIQHAPDLLSYIQVRVDELGGNGHYVLTGSHNLLMLRQVSQSLAGRTYIQVLLPLSATELGTAGLLPQELDEWIFKGGYPRLYEQARDPVPWLLSYIQTYIERDARQVIDLRNVDLFGKFLQIAAGRIGQLWNQSSVATEVGVDAMTINSWMNVLVTSYVVFKLQPHHENFTKRVVKSPKLYFHDTGLACALLGMRKAEDLSLHWARGALYENAIIADRMRSAYNKGDRPNQYFWRDNHGMEVDLLEDGPRRHLIELKSASTPGASMFKGLAKYRELYAREADYTLVHNGPHESERDGMRAMNWRPFLIGGS
jgi:predicted AAA+ superfamily ATPase